MGLRAPKPRAARRGRRSLELRINATKVANKRKSKHQETRRTSVIKCLILRGHAKIAPDELLLARESRSVPDLMKSKPKQRS